MLARIGLVSILALSVLTPSSAQPARPPRDCLHGPMDSSAQRARRDQALTLAGRINVAQGPRLPGQPYRPLDELRGLPPTPNGFALQFHSDGESYMFSIKDQLDPCRYTVFSDQDRDIYEAIVREGKPAIVPIDARPE